MSTVDFQEIKAAYSMEQVANMLGVQPRPSAGKLRGRCPICKCEDPRMFVITPEKQLYFCFAEKKGGDTLTLVSRAKDCTVREAAEIISAHFGAVRSDGSPQPPPQEKERKRGFDVDAYAKGLDPAHEALAPLGISEETLRTWKSGYSSSGILRGKLALPVTLSDGTVVAYVGRAITDQPPVFTFTKDFDPAQHIFGANRVHEGELTIVRDVLDVLRAWEGGIENCVAFLTDTISIPQFEVLISLLHEKRCQCAVIF